MFKLIINCLITILFTPIKQLNNMYRFKSTKTHFQTLKTRKHNTNTPQPPLKAR